jgi:hypothetical protein
MHAQHPAFLPSMLMQRVLHPSPEPSTVPTAVCSSATKPICEPVKTSRRSFAAAMLVATLAQLTAGPARADRTGKFSTKLTSKRRYLPRIESGFEALRGAGAALDAGATGWEGNVARVASGPIADDLMTALALYGTMQFSEGNRIGAVERRLKEIEDTLTSALAVLKISTGRGDLLASRTAYKKVQDIGNDYAKEAKIEPRL